jgi:hypothetical protein
VIVGPVDCRVAVYASVVPLVSVNEPERLFPEIVPVLVEE